MTGGLVTAKARDGVFETIQLMRTEGIRRAPIVDDTGALVGIVSLDDLLELLAEELGNLAGLLRQERNEAEVQDSEDQQEQADYPQAAVDGRLKHVHERRGRRQTRLRVGPFPLPPGRAQTGQCRASLRARHTLFVRVAHYPELNHVRRGSSLATGAGMVAGK